MKLFSKILLPTDFSDHAHEALSYATRLAQLHGGSLTLVHAYDLVPYALPEGPLMDDVQMRELQSALERQLEKLKQQALKTGTTQVTAQLLQGPAASEIVRVAGEQSFDLIVMGTHGRTGLSHLLLGSVTEKVVRRAPCAVLTVPLHDKKSG
ncbi:MAG TPA: universal stress protein [Polyangiales bacterium]